MQHNTDCSVLRTLAFLRKFAPVPFGTLCSFTLGHQKQKSAHASMALFLFPMTIMRKMVFYAFYVYLDVFQVDLYSF